jgi:uncharacterized membrane protein
MAEEEKATSTESKVMAALEELTFSSLSVIPPKIFKENEEILPGLGQRIMDEAQRRGRHREQMEKLVIEEGFKRSKEGLRWGGSIALTILLITLVLALTGYDVVAASLGLGDLALLVGVFVYGTSSQKRERFEKARILAGREIDE